MREILSSGLTGEGKPVEKREKRRMNIYVGNLPYDIDRDGLKETFAEYGNVTTARIVTDRETNRSKGFGFVEMPDDAEARQAIEALNGQELGGRKAVVNEARPREERPHSAGFGGERRGGGGFGGGERW